MSRRAEDRTAVRTPSRRAAADPNHTRFATVIDRCTVRFGDPYVVSVTRFIRLIRRLITSMPREEVLHEERAEEADIVQRDAADS
jgi:hypothetical protein